MSQSEQFQIRVGFRENTSTGDGAVPGDEKQVYI
jgi:hypothetical protein